MCVILPVFLCQEVLVLWKCAGYSMSSWVLGIRGKQDIVLILAFNITSLSYVTVSNGSVSTWEILLELADITCIIDSCHKIFDGVTMSTYYIS